MNGQSSEPDRRAQGTDETRKYVVMAAVNLFNPVAYSSTLLM
jgi:hypothetical protein